jgi:hypothetical protein
MDIETLIKQAAKEGAKEALSLSEMENIVFSRFDEKIVDLETTAKIIGIHPDTVRNHIKYKNLIPEPRPTERSPYQFRLSYVLKIRKYDLK